MQKGFGLIGILIVVAIIAGIGAFTFDSIFPDKSPFTPSEEEKSAIRQAEEMKNVLEQKSDDMGTPDNVVDETADWKTYRNEEYGFEVKYPVGWDIEKSGGSVFSFTNVDEGFVVFATGGIPGFGPYGEDIKIRQSEIVIYGVQAIRRDFEKERTLFVTISDFSLPSYVEFGIKTFGDLDLSLFEKILSTFKFLP